MRIRLLLFKGCPSGPKAEEVLRQVLAEEKISESIEIIEVSDIATAVREHFLGSPTIQINGLDIEPSRQNDPPCHGCRLYRTSEGTSGVPPKELIRSALHRALQSEK